MIIEQQRLIDAIAGYLAKYQRECRVKNFYIQNGDSKDIKHAVAIMLCEFARPMCSGLANIYVDNVNSPYFKFAKQLPENAGDVLRVSPICRTDGVITKTFSKDKIYDIYPLLDLYYSEIVQLDQNCLGSGFAPTLSEEWWIDSRDNVIKTSHAELEWADRNDSKTNIISSSMDPSKNPLWYSYTLDQKGLIAKLHQRDKITKHKTLNVPHPKVRECGYVR